MIKSENKKSGMVDGTQNHTKELKMVKKNSKWGYRSYMICPSCFSQKPRKKGTYCKDCIREMLLNEDTCKCPKCGEVKSKELFYFYASGKHNIRLCLKCWEEMVQILDLRKQSRCSDSMPLELTNLLLSRIKSTRERDPESSLAIDWAIDRWAMQRGECHYSGIPMTYKAKNDTPWFNVSLDRIDNKIGYTPANCVLCCYAANMMKRAYPLSLFLKMCTEIAFKSGTPL